MELNGHLEQLDRDGYCVLRSHFPSALIESLREAFWPRLTQHLLKQGQNPNRGPFRYFLPVPFEPPFVAQRFFFDGKILALIRCVLGSRFVADQWGCDVPLQGSEYQEFHADYQRPLFEEDPDLAMPSYMLVVSFGLHPIRAEDGPIEIAPGTHRGRRADALAELQNGSRAAQLIPLETGDVLIRHPWVLHRGTPNRSPRPRALLTIRYVRHWYADDSRDVCAIPRAIWNLLSNDDRASLRFPVSP